MTDHKLRMFCDYDRARQEVRFYVRANDPARGIVGIPSAPLTFKSVKEDEVYGVFHENRDDVPGYTGISLSPEQAKDLLEGLWQEGFRPSDAVDRSDTINAMDRHIKSLEAEIEFLRGQVVARTGAPSPSRGIRTNPTA